MKITSSAFLNNHRIPDKYTCVGENVSPPLDFSEIPEGTQSLALIVTDPDAQTGNFCHWLIWDIPPDVRAIPENSFPENSVQGRTDFGEPGWSGPCPASGIHRYYFRLFALDKKIESLLWTSSRPDLEFVMRDSVIDQAELIGLFSKPLGT